ncbi:CopG family transcriptional regulator [Pleurocapsales cyanobacterium LEGE 10410]|nr:CopG family transcriptional regulator [Pleurocapsales cyanobacterium LEGE 10410]
MNRKKRKPLDDSLANEFVFGGNEPEEAAPAPDIEPEAEVTAEPEPTPTTPMPEKPAPKSNKESSLMQKLQLEAKEPTKRFTIDLRESVHRKLSILAAKTGRSKADIVRMLLDDALEDINE